MPVEALNYPLNSNTCGGAFDPVMPPSFKPDTYCEPSPYYSVDVKRLLGGIMNSVEPMQRTSLGLCGTPEYLSGAAVSAGGVYYSAIMVLNNAILNVAAGQTNEVNSSGADVNLGALAGVTLPAGTVLLGVFKKVVLTSGVIKLMPLSPVLIP